MRAALSCHLPSRWYYALGYLYSESRAQIEKEKGKKEDKTLYQKDSWLPQEHTEKKKTFGVSSSSLSKSLIITLKLLLKMKVIRILIVSSYVCVALYNLKSISSAIIWSLMKTPRLRWFIPFANEETEATWATEELTELAAKSVESSLKTDSDTIFPSVSLTLRVSSVSLKGAFRCSSPQTL